MELFLELERIERLTERLQKAELNSEFDPNAEATASVRHELEKIYESSPMFSARYHAAEALGLDSEDLRQDLSGWIKEAELNLCGVISIKGGNNGYPTKTAIPDILVRWRALQDLQWMYDTLPMIEDRARAGEALGYSDLRIWAHENPWPAAMTGISMVGGVGWGLFYLLDKYFGK